jgi:hypothetical protein
MVCLHTKDLEYYSKMGDSEGVAHATLALKSIIRVVVSLTHAAWGPVPMDWESLSFWTHRSVALAAFLHIKLGERNKEWQSDLDVLKKYLKHFAPRMKLYSQ